MVPVRLALYHQATNKLKAQTRSLWMSKQMQNSSKTKSLRYKTLGEKTTGKIIGYKLFVKEAIIETKDKEATLAIITMAHTI